MRPSPTNLEYYFSENDLTRLLSRQLVGREATVATVRCTSRRLGDVWDEPIVKFSPRNRLIIIIALIVLSWCLGFTGIWAISSLLDAILI